MTRLLDLWYDIRPFFGHALLGIAIGCFVAVVAISLSAAIGGVSTDTLVTLAFWTLGTFITAIVVSAFGMILYYNPWDREQYAARHALRRSERL